MAKTVKQTTWVIVLDPDEQWDGPALVSADITIRADRIDIIDHHDGDPPFVCVAGRALNRKGEVSGRSLYRKTMKGIASL